jgi:WD40 repeat protein
VISEPGTLRCAAARRFLLRCLLLPALLCACSWVPCARAQDEAALVLNVKGHTGPVRRTAVDAAGRFVVTASDDKTAIVWRLADGAIESTLRVPVGEDEIGRLYGAAVSPDGSRVAVAGTTAGARGVQRIYVFDVASGSFSSAIDARGGDIRNLAWSPDGTLIAAAYAGQPALRVFDPGGRLVYENLLPADTYGLSIRGDGQLVVSSFDAKLRVFRIEAGAVRAEAEIGLPIADPVGVRHSPDGRLIAVGYFSRASRERVQVDVFDAATREHVKTLQFTDVPQGNLMNVAWRADGRALYAGGTGYRDAGRFVIKRISWPDGAADTIVAATDSVLDLAALSDGRIAFASFDARWGLVDGTRVAWRSDTPIGRVTAASALRISADAAVAEWQADGDVRSFALPARRIGERAAEATRSAEPSTARLRLADWENTRQPSLNGRRIELLPNESARAAAVLPDGGSLVLASSRALRRIDRDGATRWTVRLATEARAVNVSGNGRVLVAALADGTLRWRRTDDGAPLLALLVLRDGRWVAWTESGYYDAGPGAEDLVGWLVPRPGGERADFFGASRFRERYLRPDVIDRVLTALDPAAALGQANDERMKLAAQQQASAEAFRQLEANLQPPPVQQILPPVVTVAQPVHIEAREAEVPIDFKVYEPSGAPIEHVEVRVDGRPVPVTEQPRTQLPDGQTAGRVVVALPRPDGRIEIFAEASGATSMPALVEFHTSAPAVVAKAAGRTERKPALYLLSVGISRYANPEMNLGLAAKDAQDFAQAFRHQEGLYYKRVETRVLTDDAATRAAVLAGLRWLQNAPGPDDIAILFLAGHGVNDAADLYHFLPFDAKEKQIGQTSVSESNLRQTLSAVKGRTLFFVDTCFAGKSVGKLTRRELTRLANGLATSELGVIVFSASAPRQESLEDDSWGNGAFTKALVAGLGGAADFRREGVVTHRGLDYFVGHEVRTLTQGRQTPVTAVPNGIADFPLAAVERPADTAHKE